MPTSFHLILVLKLFNKQLLFCTQGIPTWHVEPYLANKQDWPTIDSFWTRKLQGLVADIMKKNALMQEPMSAQFLLLFSVQILKKTCWISCTSLLTWLFDHLEQKRVLWQLKKSINIIFFWVKIFVLLYKSGKRF